MAFDWEVAANSEGPPQAERIPVDGRPYPVRISKIVYGKRDEGPYKSSKGHPQILVIFQDELAREASTKLTLSVEASFTLAKILRACDPPVDMTRLKDAGIVPASFADPEFTDANLIGRQLAIALTPNDNPNYPPIVTPHPRRGDASVAPPASIDAPPSTANAQPPSPYASPPASDAPPSIDEPPPSDDLPPPVEQLQPLTKDQAWKKVLESWVGCNVENRNAAWKAAIRDTGKNEAVLTGQDWAEVAQQASTPF